MINFLDNFIDTFVGRFDTLVIGTEKGWIGRKWVLELPTKSMRETLRQLILNKKRFAIYSQFKQNGKWRCKFVALDLDLHGDIPNKEDMMNKLSERIDDILSHAKKFFFCDESYIIKEKTSNGYHLYIPLMPTTKKGGTNATYPTQDVVLYYIRMIEDKLNLFLEDILPDKIEIFPKGRVIGDESSTFGTAIRFHLNGEWIWRINKLNKLEIEPIVRRAKEINYPSLVIGNNKKSDLDVQFSGKLTDKKRNIKEMPNILQRYCELIDAKKCIVNSIKGKYNLRGNTGNKMRVRIVQELYNLDVPIEDIIQVFESQSDFDYKKSKYHVEQCIKNNYPYPTCDSIKATGFCDPTCWMLKTVTKSKLSKKKEREKVPNPLNGWDELLDKIGELIKSGKRYFIRKTTRSGTTTATILEAIRQKKKMLMVAPTKKIYDDTLQKAITKYGLKRGITPPFPKTYKIASNGEICPRLNDMPNKDKMLDVFPFLLKPSCSECKESCRYRKFKENMADYDIVFLSTQKLRVLIDNAQTSDEAWYFLKELIDWCDFVFIDECYHMFEINFFSIPIIQEKYNSFTKENYPYSCKKKYMTAIDDFIQWLGEENTFTQRLEDFIENIYDVNDIKKSANNFIVKIEENEIKEFLESGKNWTKTYQQFITFYKDIKNKEIRFLVNFFIGLGYLDIYFQKRMRWNGNEVAELICINSIENFMSFLNNLNKPIIITDAVYPPIDLNKVFDNLEEININDPMRTADKQTVVVLEKSDPFYKRNMKPKDLINFLKKYGYGKNFLVSQSKKYDRFIGKVIKKEGIDIDIKEKTYHRSDKTIGVESDLRKMIVIAGSFIPRHVYDIPALKYIELGYLDEENISIAGRYLENANARSAFFQTISRVKDPHGKEESIVFVYGMEKEVIEEWFIELGISTPKILSLSEWEEELKKSQDIPINI